MSDTVGCTIEKKLLPTLLLNESKRSRVFIPKRSDGVTEYAVFGKGDKPDLEAGQSRQSPKSFFFPQTETLYAFDYDTIEPSASEEAAEAPVVLFAVRPCDSASVELLDQVFGPENHGYHDPYYEKKRDNTIVVTLACNKPGSTCFCTSVGGDPAGTRGADVLAFDLEDRLYLEGLTTNGKEFLARNGEVLKEAAETDREVANTLASSARESMPVVEYDRATVKKNLDDQFDNPIWEKITNTCIGCGACTYLCPTCHCFDICDEERHYKGRRIRTWDSCQYAQFTKHASGHNPRPTKTERLRQRFMHKFSYTVESVDEVYCVGCGRCVRYCPVNLDIREVLREFSST